MELEGDESAAAAAPPTPSSSDSAQLITDPNYLGLSGDINALTTGLQRHFDSIILENQRLKKERDESRREITHLMYLRDGATRVVAKQLDEIHLLKKKVAELEQGNQQRDAAHPSPAAALADSQQLTEVSPAVYNTIVEKFNVLAKALLQSRKQRVIQARQPDAWKTYITEFPATPAQDFKGSTCLTNILSGVEDAKSSPNAYVKRLPHLFAVGTSSGLINVHDWRKPSPLATLRGHEGPVTCLGNLVFPSTSHLRLATLAALNASSSSPAPFRSAVTLFSGGQDGTVRLWTAQKLKEMENIDFLVDLQTPSVGGFCKYADLSSRDCSSTLDMACDYVFRLHDRTREESPSSIIFSKLHPAGTHLATATLLPESGWALLDLISLKLVKAYRGSNVTCTDLCFQPDGNLVVGIDPTGSGSLPVWDLRSADIKASPKPPNIKGKLTSVDFSETGYYIVTTTSCGKGQVWDLRKAEVVQEYQLGGPIHKAKFDFSGRHIAFAGTFGTVVYSAQDKKNYTQAASWDGDCGPEGIREAYFDHVTDDYLLTLADPSAGHSGCPPIRCHMAK